MYSLTLMASVRTLVILEQVLHITQNSRKVFFISLRDFLIHEYHIPLNIN